MVNSEEAMAMVDAGDFVVVFFINPTQIDVVRRLGNGNPLATEGNVFLS